MENEWNGIGCESCCPSGPYIEFGARARTKRGFSHRRVKSLREVLANLACKLRCLLVHVQS